MNSTQNTTPAEEASVRLVADVARQMFEADSEEEINAILARALGALIGPQVVIGIIAFPPKGDLLGTSAVVEPGRLSRKLADVPGMRPIYLVGDYPVELKSGMAQGRLVPVGGGVPELFREAIDVASVRPDASEPGFADVYVVGLVRAGRVLGGVNIITLKSGLVLPAAMIEAIVGMGAAALEKTRATFELTLLQKAVEAWPDGVFWMDGEDRFAGITHAGAGKLGYDREDLIGRHVSEVAPTATPERMREVWQRLRRHGYQVAESMHRRKDGTEYPIEVTSAYVEVGGKQFNCGFARDITERKIAEERLRESESHFRALYDNSSELIYVHSLDGKFLDANPAALRTLGYERHEVGQLSLAKLISAEELTKVACALREILETGRTKEPYEYRLRHKAGHTVDVRTSGVLLARGGQPFAVLGLACDITKEREVQRLAEQSHDQLRRLASNTTTVLENERLAISRRIHDDLGQYLTALRLDAAALVRHLSVADTTVCRRAQEMIQTIDDTISSVQAIAGELRPGALDRLGLPAAIEEQCRRFEDRAGISCVFIGDPDARPADDLVATAAYRIVQELLTNVSRHAQANQVWVKLTRLADVLHLRVHDNGVGITEAQMQSPTALGIISIRERVLAEGGQVSFEALPGQGTDVKVDIPVARWFSTVASGGSEDDPYSRCR